MSVPPSPLPAADDFTTADLLRLVYADLGATISVIGRDLKFRYVNAGFATAFNHRADEMIGMPIQIAYGDVHHEGYMPYLRRAMAGEKVHYERLGRTKDTEGIWRTVSLYPWRNSAGEIVGVVTASLQVQELKASTEALRAANERLSSHMDNSPLSVIELDADLKITHASARVQQMLGLNAKAIEGMRLFDALASGADSAFEAAFEAAFQRLQSGAEARNRVESRHTRADGSPAFCEWFNSALTDETGRVTSIMALVEDISLRVKAEAQLRHIALHDQLTGLPNRSALAERLIAALTRANRTHERVALLFIDLDGFKRVNDIYGHASGDETLREVARRLLLAVRDTDVVARIGGDEFVVLLETEVLEGTPDLVCTRIFGALQPVIRFANGEAPIGASIGIAMHPPLLAVADDLLKRADAAMYEAKHAGKGCVRYAVA